MWKNHKAVLGINARSSIYLRENKPSARKRADDKLATKACMKNIGIPTADLIAVIRNRHELREFDWESLPSSFVIKPNRGLGGEGIVVVYNRLKNGNWLTTNKRQLTVEDFVVHVADILDGDYSLLNTPDIAFLESRLSIDPLFKRFGEYGIPDIGVVVYNLVPVMAFIRVPTKKSGGKANLMQGGLAIGIDISTGLTTHVVMKAWWGEREIERHPDNDVLLRGMRIPYWEEILKTAVLASQSVKLKYTRVDISIDKKKGPVVLELNARPGLGIQVANMIPLRERLDRIKGLRVESPEHGITIAKDLFGGHFQAEVTSVTGRQVVGLVESVTVYGVEDKQKQVKAKIDTGADDSSIDMALARELGFGDAIDAFAAEHIPEELSEEEAKRLLEDLQQRLPKAHPQIARISKVHSSHGASIRFHIPLSIFLAGHKMSIEPNVFDRSRLEYPLLIGNRNLTRFLIDPTKRSIKKVAAKKNGTPKPATPTMTTL
ncbi:MAG: ATP-dependent zinc protease [Candidatus Kerfeldbacteria bacterium]|nr:ATP-dependent zinc protease [Candidatus Kerfeldbacteria bacterium]